MRDFEQIIKKTVSKVQANWVARLVLILLKSSIIDGLEAYILI